MNAIAPQQMLEAIGKRMGAMRGELDTEIAKIAKQASENESELVALVELVAGNAATAERRTAEEAAAIATALAELGSELAASYGKTESDIMELLRDLAKADQVEQLEELTTATVDQMQELVIRVAGQGEKLEAFAAKAEEAGADTLARLALATPLTDFDELHTLTVKTVDALKDACERLVEIETGLEAFKAETAEAVEELAAHTPRQGEKGDPGEPGAPGRDGQSLMICGTWSSEKEYRAGDIVIWDGASWGCNLATATGEEPGTLDKWQILASRGRPGKEGKASTVAGPPGEAGERGGRGPAIVRARLVGREAVLEDEDGRQIWLSLEPLMLDLAAASEARLRDIELKLGML